ncbi:MAG: recombinase family protein, partial [Candidatus Thorarchaeota archaeon]
MPLYKRKPGNIVQWIFKNFIDCKSYAELAKMLNKKKVPSPKDTISKKNGKVNSLSSWNRQHVKNILTNNFYLGERLKAKNYLNLVNEDLWYDVQEIVQEIQRL